jgi:hypothetical protein
MNEGELVPPIQFLASRSQPTKKKSPQKRHQQPYRSMNGRLMLFRRDSPNQGVKALANFLALYAFTLRGRRTPWPSCPSFAQAGPSSSRWLGMQTGSSSRSCSFIFRPILGSPMTRSDDLSRPEPGGRIDPLADDLTRQRRSAGRLGPGSEDIRWQLWTHQRWRQHPLLRPAKASPRYEVSISKPAKQMQGGWVDRIRAFFPLIRTEDFFPTQIY